MSELLFCLTVIRNDILFCYASYGPDDSVKLLNHLRGCDELQIGASDQIGITTLYMVLPERVAA